MSDERTVLICIPATSPVHVAGASKMPCGDCGAECWVSPASLFQVAGHRHGFVIVCAKCVNPRLEAMKRAGDEIEFLPPSAGVIDELRKALSK